jgi:DNA-binding NarL/FixJ family response regulator
LSIRVYLCDDVPEFRSLMRFALEDDQDIEVVGEAADGHGAVSGVRETLPDVVLLDLSMPGYDGLQAIPRLREVAPDTSIVVLSGFTAARMAPQVLAAGAHSYIEKGESFAGIRRAVHEAVAQRAA